MPCRWRSDEARLTESPHAPSTERLRAAVISRGLEQRVTPVVGDMADLDQSPASFDLIWSEGALYNTGIEKALGLCHRQLDL